MLNLKIAQLNLTNFKGVSELTLPESRLHDVTSKDTAPGERDYIEGDGENVLSDNVKITGANGAGKTTIKEAIAFLFTGRNSSGRTDDFIKKGSESCFVAAHIYAAREGYPVEKMIVGRGIRAKQSNKRGESQVKGYETVAELNGIEVKVSELEKTLADLVTPEDFQVLFNPLYLSLLNWDKRRELLLRATSGVTELEIAYEERVSVADSLKTHSAGDLIKSYKKETKAANSKIDELTHKKEEAARSLPDESEIADAEKRYEDVAKKLEDVSDSIDKRAADVPVSDDLTEASQAFEAEKRERVRKFEDYLAGLREKRGSNRDRLGKIDEELRSLTKDREDLRGEISELEKEQKELREKWDLWSIYEPSRDENIADPCPTCGQKPNAETLSALIQKKAEETQKVLEVTKNKGRSVSEALTDRRAQEEKLEAQIRYLNKEAEELKKKNADLDNEIESAVNKGSEEVIGLSHAEKEAADRLENLKAEASSNKDEELESLKEKRWELRKALEEAAAVTAKRETLNNIRGRIEELERLIKLESERYNEALRIIEELEGVVARRVEILEGELERVFSDEGLPISFSMFERKLNGELAETCQIIYRGRSFDNLSNGEQLAIGYRLSERLKLLLGIVTPTFIDNYEALTIELSGEAGQKFLAEVSSGELQTCNL
jgi:DNA repair exonuclease SbcCD ATPase subunit